MNNIPIQIINQFFEIEQKINIQNQSTLFERNFNKLKALFEEEGYLIQDPVNESYSDSRTDCEASIVGKVTSKMKITKTLKPVIYKKSDNTILLIQKAVVFVESI